MEEKAHNAAKKNELYSRTDCYVGELFEMEPLRAVDFILYYLSDDNGILVLTKAL